jgi:GNAT superfamily N-acetyltransferase
MRDAMIVRAAVEADREQLRAHGKAHVAEVTPDEVWDDAQADATFDRAIKNGNPAVYVAETDGHVIGYVAARVVEKPFTSGLFIELDLLYVEPRYRGSRAAALLMDTYDRWASMFGKCEQYAQYTDNIPDVVLRMLTKRGFKIHGVILKRD